MQVNANGIQSAGRRARAGCLITAFTVLAWLAAFPLAGDASAQVTTATVVGTVNDASGAALPGVTVTARNTDTGFVRDVLSSDTGAYRLEFLPIGPYVVEATLQGFKTASRGGIVLNVNDSVRVDLSLEIGAVTETVRVVAGTPLVNTVTSDISKTIDDVAIQSLPLVDRNTYSLLDLTPGVQSNNNGVASASVTTSSLGLGFPEQRTLINGGADGGTGSVNYYLDGGINMTALRNTGNILPEPRRHPGIQGPDQRLQRRVRPLLERHHQRHHQGWDQSLSRLRVRVLPQRQDEREGMGLAGGEAAARAQSIRRHARRTDRAERDVLLCQFLRSAPDHADVHEQRHRADRGRTDGRFPLVEDPPERPRHRAAVCVQRGGRRHLCRQARSRRDEDHQRPHSARQRCGRHLAGLLAKPVRHRRIPDQARSPAHRRASPVGQLLSHRPARTSSVPGPATCRGPASSSPGRSTTSTSATPGC